MRHPIRGPATSASRLVSTGREDVSGDIFSFGVSFYHLVCSEPPFKGEKTEEILQARFIQTPVHLRAHLLALQRQFRSDWRHWRRKGGGAVCTQRAIGECCEKPLQDRNEILR